MKRILIVDGLEPGRSPLEASLRGGGYETVSVRDGAPALAEARRQPPHLVITDIVLPVMDGFALCREWRADAALRGIPFVFYSSTNRGAKDEEMALASGADRFVLRPQEPQAMNEIIREVLFASMEKKLVELEASHRRLVEDARQRQVMEDALRQSQEQFQRLFQSSPLGTVLYSALDGCILNVNARFLELMQCDLEEVVGRTGHELGVWCDPGTRDRLLERLHHEKHVHSFEARLRSKRGLEYDMLLSAQLIELPTGQVVMVQAQDITDRKRSEAALRDKDRLLREVIDMVPHFIFAKDRHSRFLFVNRVAAEAVGMSPEQLVGLSDLDIPRNREEAEAFMQDDREVIASGKPKFVPEEHLTDIAGRVRIHQTIKIPFLAPGTGEPALLGVAVDITELKHAEQELRTAHDRITVLAHLTRELADSTTPRDAALLILQTARQLIDWDCSWLQLWNEETQQFEDLADFDRVDGECRELPPNLSTHWDPAPMMRRAMQQGPQLLLRQDETDQIDGFRLIGNQRRSLSLMYAPIRHAGRLIGMVSIQSYRKQAYDHAALDLLQTLASHCAGALARIQSTQALVESGERFRLIFEGANDAIFWADAETSLLTHCNRAAEALLGWERAEIIGQPQGFLHPPEEAARYQQLFREHASSRSKPRVEAEVVRKDGQRVAVSISPSVTTIGGRQVIQGIFHDITERKRMEASLRLTQFTIDRAVDSVFWVAPSSEIFYVNDAACRTLGYSREELIGNTVPGIDPNFPAEAWPAHWEELKLRKSFSFESDHQRKDGSPIKTEVTVNYLEFEGREYNCAIMRDITARKQAEERLAVMRFCVDRAGDSVSWVSREGRILYVNDAFCGGRGYSRDEMLGMMIFDLDPDFQAGVWGPHWQELKQRGTLTFESRHRAKDGRVFPVEINANYVHIGEQEFNFASVRDITARKQAEARIVAFSDLGRKLSAAQTAREAGEIIVEVADRLIGWDACLVDLLSAADDHVHSVLRKDIVNGVRADVTADDGDRAPTPRMRRVFSQGAELILRDTAGAITPDGVMFGDTSRASLSLLNVPIRDGTRSIGLLSIQSYQPKAYTPQDLDLLQVLADHCSGALHRLRAEGEVRRLAAFPQLNPNPVLELISDGTINYFNEAAGHLAHELGFKHPADMLPPETTAIVRQCLDSGLSKQRIEVPCNQRIISWSFHPIPAQCVVHCYAGDVTERQQLEGRLRQAQKMEAIGTLAGGIAHDFNNLLGVMLGNAELARMDLDDRRSALMSIDEILSTGQRAKELVQRILTFSRPQEKKLEPTQLQTVLDEVVRLLRSTLPAGVALAFQSAPAVPAVQADASQIHQVVLNVATNAWHAMEGQVGRIEMRLEPCQLEAGFCQAHPELRPGPHVRLSISDTGKGMDAITLGRIFEPFFTTKAPGQGTGLGLSMVHGILRSHGGGITVESEPGRGSTFHLYFPALAEKFHATLLEPVTAATVRGHGEHILYLDDEQPLVHLAKRFLERLGYRVTGYTQPAEAVAAFSTNPQDFDLVITDFNMPGLSGMEVARQLMSIRPDVPVVMLSGFLREAEIDTARAMGIREVLLKPNTVEELISVLGPLLLAR